MFFPGLPGLGWRPVASSLNHVLQVRGGLFGGFFAALIGAAAFVQGLLAFAQAFFGIRGSQQSKIQW